MRRLAVGLLAVGLAVLVWLLFFSGAATNTGPLPPVPGDRAAAGDLSPILSPGSPKNTPIPRPTGPPGEAPRQGAPGWVLIRAREAGTNRPVVLAGVTVSQRGFRSHFKTSRDGTVWVGPVEPGVTQMHFAHGRVVDRGGTWFVYPAASPEAHQEIIVDLVGAYPISGRVVTTEGTPGRGQLSARPLTPGEAEVGTDRLGRVAEDGRFTSSPLPPGRYEIVLRQAAGPSHYGGYVVVGRWQAQAGDEGLVLTYEARPVLSAEPVPKADHGELTVHLVTPGGGRVRSARVLVVSAPARLPLPGGGYERANPYPVQHLKRKDDTYRFRILRPGELVWISVKGAVVEGAQTCAPALVGPLTLAPGTRSVSLKPGRRVAGRVLTAEGGPLEGCWVSVNRDGRLVFPRNSSSGSAKTDRDGRFLVEGLGEGKHRIDLRNVGDHLAVRRLIVQAGTEDVEIKLRRGATPRIRVLDANGDPVVGALVQATPMGQPPDFGGVATDWEGVANLPDLAPEVLYRLVVGDQCSGKDLAPYCRENWQPKDTTLNLPAGGKITGTVQNDAGEPLALASVVFRGEDGRIAHASTRSHGSFELRVPAGASGLLRAYAPGTRWHQDDEGGIPAVAGASGVVFRCVENVVLEVRVLNWPPGAMGRVVLSLPDGLRPGQTTVRGGRGALLLERLPPGQVGRLEISCPEKGLAATVERVSTDAGRIEVILTDALAIDGWLKVPEGVVPHSVVATKNYLNVSGRLSPNGQFTIPGLTPGAWTVVGRAFRGKTTYSGDRQVEAGGTIVIAVAPEEE